MTLRDILFWRVWFKVARLTAGYSLHTELENIRVEFGRDAMLEVQRNLHLL